MKYFLDVVERVRAGRSKLSRALLVPRRWPEVPGLAMRRFLYGDHPVIGWWGRRRGSTVHLAGCTFQLEPPQVSNAIFSRFVLGRYESPELAAIADYLPPDLPLIELGGGLGVLSCVANRRLNDPQRHWVIEANPELIPLIEKQRTLNECSFSVQHAALSYVDPALIYVNRAHVTATSAQRTRGELIEVPSISIERLLDTHGIHECTLMVDIEGAELELVESEAEVLQRHVKTIIMEVHPDVYGEDGVQRVRDSLRDLDFELLRFAPPVLVMQRRRAPSGPA